MNERKGHNEKLFSSRTLHGVSSWTRIVHVQAESKEQALDNDYDLIDVIEDCWVDGEVQEADTITDTNHLMNGWTELAVECNDAGVPLAQVKQWEEE